MFTIGTKDCSRAELLAELRRQSELPDATVVWHDQYTPVLVELEDAGETKYGDINALLLTIGSMLVGEPGYRRSYAFFIDQGARKILAGPPAFESSGAKKLFNATYWLQVGIDDDAHLQLEPGKSAAEAVLDMVEHPRDWTFDCAAFVQAVELYARVRAVGATQFDKDMAGKRFRFKEHGSTGLAHRRIFFRSALEAPWRLRTPATDLRDTEEPTCDVAGARLLSIAPVGSRVTFANADPKAENTDYERENTVKLGPDSFASHPFGVLGSAALCRQLAQQTILRYSAEIDENLTKAADGKNTLIDPETAAKGLEDMAALVEQRDTDAQVAWIFEHREWTENLLYDDLNEYVDNQIYLAEVEVYTVTPEDDATKKFEK